MLRVMTIKFKHGDMFQEPTQAIVNTVNCVGVMGKGVALEFKKRWPDNFEAYRKLCRDKKLVPGNMFVFDRGGIINDGPRFLINFPTKNNWRSKSKISYITDGLDDLVKKINGLNITSITIPPLGCGNGGLGWKKVKPIIEEKLNALSNVEIIIFSPKDENDIPEHTPNNIKMTFERAILLKALSDLENYFDGSFDRISLQKIAYFIQAMGINLNLDFSGNIHGPYSEVLKKAYVYFDKIGVISGFHDGERRAHVTRYGCAVADEYLRDNPKNSNEIISRINKLIQGYESPYGLELLSSIHWNYTNKGKEINIKNNDNINNNYSESIIDAATKRLKKDNLL